MKENTLKKFGLGKLEMINIKGGDPAPSTLPTQNYEATNYYIAIIADRYGDAYPDDCCQE